MIHLKPTAIFTLGFLFLFFNVFSQETPNELDNKYKPQNLSSSSSGGGSGSSNETYPNIIKINAGMALRSIGSLSYERAITKNFGLELGAGIVFGRDIFQVLSYEADLLETESNNYINFALYGANVANAGLGNMFQVNPKYYFDGEGLSGPYISLEYRYVKNKFITPVTYDVVTTSQSNGYAYTSANSVRKNIPNRLSNNNLNFMVGNTYQSSHFMFEVYGGLGARITDLYKMEYTLSTYSYGLPYEYKTTDYDTYQGYRNNYGGSDTYTSNIKASTEKERHISMTLLFGINFGVAF